MDWVFGLKNSRFDDVRLNKMEIKIIYLTESSYVDSFKIQTRQSTQTNTSNQKHFYFILFKS